MVNATVRPIGGRGAGAEVTRRIYGLRLCGGINHRYEPRPSGRHDEFPRGSDGVRDGGIQHGGMTSYGVVDSVLQDPFEPSSTPEALPYHRLGRLAQPRRWWRPLAVAGAAVGFYLVMLIVLIIAMVVITAISTGSIAELDDLAMDDLTQPLPFTFGMLSIALMMPAVLLAVPVVGRRPIGTTISVAGRMRWGLLGQALLVTFGCLLVLLAITFALDPVTPRLVGGLSGALIMAGLGILITPFQAAAEEFAFRALPMQVLGAWLRSPIWGILLPVPLFVLGHGYSIQGQLEVGLFAVLAGYLTWRTGGLEAAIGLHVVNNLVLTLISTVGLADPNLTEISWGTAAMSGGYTLVAAGGILLLVRRREARGEVLRVRLGATGAAR